MLVLILTFGRDRDLVWRSQSPGDAAILSPVRKAICRQRAGRVEEQRTGSIERHIKKIRKSQHNCSEANIDRVSTNSLPLGVSIGVLQLRMSQTMTDTDIGYSCRQKRIIEGESPQLWLICRNDISGSEVVNPSNELCD
jgi:hypothetical protein